MIAGLGLCAVVAALVGMLFLSQATAGVGLVALGCFFAIFTRIAQAHKQHQEQVAARTRAVARTPAPSPDAGEQTL